MTTISQRLATIQHQPTRYEIIAHNTKTGRQLLIAYTSQRSRHGILRAMFNRSDDVIRALGTSTRARPRQRHRPRRNCSTRRRWQKVCCRRSLIEGM